VDYHSAVPVRITSLAGSTVRNLPNLLTIAAHVGQWHYSLPLPRIPCVAGDSAVAHRTGKVSLESRLAEKREKATAHQRKRDVVYSALGRVFGSFW
jgi:hypothetical protein